MASIQIRDEKLRELASVFNQLIQPPDAGEAPPWVDPPVVDGRSLFPRGNDADALEFFLLVGALNYSYWTRTGDGVRTWGVQAEKGSRVEDVFALCYCLRRGVDDGVLPLEASAYETVTTSETRRLFSGSGGNDIPMLETRRRKINELGKGLRQFAEVSGEDPTLADFLASYRTFPAVLDALEQFFPYSFGDPFRQLSQLMLKMIVDRREAAQSGGHHLGESSPTWTEATRSLSIDRLKAQPDYMLPLYCLKTGIWSIDGEIREMYRRRRELPMDHPIEREIRRATVTTVERLSEELGTETGRNTQGIIDSLMWMTAVQGCFPVDCEGCDFHEYCDAVNDDNDRLYWDHHLTRTTYY